jgi:hypothetical protein
MYSLLTWLFRSLPHTCPYTRCRRNRINDSLSRPRIPRPYTGSLETPELINPGPNDGLGAQMGANQQNQNSLANRSVLNGSFCHLQSTSSARGYSGLSACSRTVCLAVVDAVCNSALLSNYCCRPLPSTAQHFSSPMHDSFLRAFLLYQQSRDEARVRRSSRPITCSLVTHMPQ